MMQEQDGQVGDLVKDMEAGSMTAAEAISHLEDRGLTEKAVFKYSYWAYLIWVIPCLLPGLWELWGLGFWDFLARLPRVIFPPVVAYIAFALFLAAIPLTVWGMVSNRKRGGCSSEDHTVVLLRDGPYAIIRHPSHFAWSVFFITIPIFMSKYVPFTFLSIIGIVGITLYHYYASIKEERELDMKKWGSQYLEYMEQVPRWNIIKGLINLARRR